MWVARVGCRWWEGLSRRSRDAHGASAKVGGSYTKAARGRPPVRITAAFKRLLGLPGVNVRSVEFTDLAVVVTVALRRRRLVCPECSFSTRTRYDRRPSSPAGATWPGAPAARGPLARSPATADQDGCGPRSSTRSGAHLQRLGGR